MAHRDPAYLFYDADAAKDVSHMNRLERGCYFDFLQAQRKFHGITIEQAKKILGKDFESCWSALELILSVENNQFYIEWLRNSIIKRSENAELQRKRIQDYWDKKKKEDINHGNTVVLPLVNENVIVNENENKEIGVEEKLHPIQIMIKTEELLSPLLKLKKQLTYKQADELEKKYSKELIIEKVKAIANKANVENSYNSVYLTISSWCNGKLK